MKKLSRRALLKISGVTAAGVVITASGCAPASTPKPAEPVVNAPPPAPQATATTAPAGSTATSAPAATATPASLATTGPAPTITPTLPQKAYRRPEIIKFHPDAKSRVVHTRSAEVWNGDKLVQSAVRKMVDNSIVALTGLKDAKSAWKALFDPSERIAIKVNAFRNSVIWTHVELVKAVTDSLQEAGVPGEQIIIYDYLDDELKTAGFTLNRDGPGVRCYGTEGKYSTRWPIAEKKSTQLSDILLDVDALINMPILKSHMIAGVTFALKNHFGSVSYPDGLHNISQCLPGLNALPPIKQATRLVIGDILTANTMYSEGWPYWEADYKGDSILMSYDPLAHDAVGYQMLLKMSKEKGNNTDFLVGMADPWFKTAAEAGIGTSDMNNIELVEV